LSSLQQAALGGLAVAALANFGLRLFHLGGASIVVLFRHSGSLAVLAALAAFIGRQVLYWRHIVAGPQKYRACNSN
jgi:uncharacterized YccA/Bax inhibitor family protein